MTPQQIETAARNRYNAIGDNFWSQAEILDMIYLAMLELSSFALPIEKTYTTSTVVSQQEYDFPSQLISIKRIEYAGAKLSPIDFRDDDALTLNNAATTDEGTPQYYMIWNEVIILRPIPDAIGTLKIRGYVEPQIPTVSSTLELPTMWHAAIIDFCTREMFAKEKDTSWYDRYDRKWQSWMIQAKQWAARKKRTDGYAVVKNEDSASVSLLGAI